MILNEAKTQSTLTKSRWLTLVAILVFLLLALIIWRWFDYQIARLTFPSSKGVSGVMTQYPSTSTDTVKSPNHE